MNKVGREFSGPLLCSWEPPPPVLPDSPFLLTVQCVPRHCVDVLVVEGTTGGALVGLVML